jgi:O-methyltransferase
MNLLQHARVSVLEHARATYKKRVPAWAQYLVRALRRRRDMAVCWEFIRHSPAPISRWQRTKIVARLYWISLRVDCQHTQQEVLSYVEHILCLPAGSPDVVVEAGCFKGGSTAKFSLAAKISGKTLVVFDSYGGLPDNEEEHGKTIFGVTASFQGGTYAGTLEEVRGNVARHGNVEVCEFIKGWFSDTMPGFQRPIAAAYLDVDLAASTKDCLVNLWPLLPSGGRIYSQDGHLPLVLDVFHDEAFWRDEVGADVPQLVGVGVEKLIYAIKP